MRDPRTEDGRSRGRISQRRGYRSATPMRTDESSTRRAPRGENECMDLGHKRPLPAGLCSLSAWHWAPPRSRRIGEFAVEIVPHQAVKKSLYPFSSLVRFNIFATSPICTPVDHPDRHVGAISRFWSTKRRAKSRLKFAKPFLALGALTLSKP